LILALLLLGGGLVPQPGVENRYRVAAQLHQQRQALGPQDGQPAIDGEASTSHGAFSSSVFGMRESLP
jgi:hypothetical protein